jgi:hypothetical protein
MKRAGLVVTLAAALAGCATESQQEADARYCSQEAAQRPHPNSNLEYYNNCITTRGPARDLARQLNDGAPSSRPTTVCQNVGSGLSVCR